MKTFFTHIDTTNYQAIKYVKNYMYKNKLILMKLFILTCSRKWTFNHAVFSMFKNIVHNIAFLRASQMTFILRHNILITWKKKMDYLNWIRKKYRNAYFSSLSRYIMPWKSNLDIFHFFLFLSCIFKVIVAVFVVVFDEFYILR